MIVLGKKPDEDILKAKCKALPRNRRGKRAAQTLIRRHFAGIAAWERRLRARKANKLEARTTPAMRTAIRLFDRSGPADVFT